MTVYGLLSLCVISGISAALLAIQFILRNTQHGRLHRLSGDLLSLR